MTYKQFVKLAVLAGAISLDRPSMKTKVMDSPEVLEVIHEMPHIGRFVEALYNCQYQEFFQSLGILQCYCESYYNSNHHCSNR